MNTEKKWQWQEGEFIVTRSTAWSGPGCHEGCGVLLYTKDGKLVKVEGDPENPFNQGRLCVRCLALPQITHHPDRLMYPMKRSGKRGENKWERITWQEAFDVIADKFNQVKRDFGPEAVLFSQGTGRDIMAYIGRLAYTFGSPNWSSLGLTGGACYAPRVWCLALTSGGFATADCSQYFENRYDNPNWKAPECIVVWGNNPVVSNSDGFFGHWIVDCMKRGSKLIVIDPRMTWLASRAHVWLQIRPGTDAALALGLLNIIINNDWYDHEFVDKWTYGFDRLKVRVDQYTLKKVSEITWIPEEKIVKAADLFSHSKPASIQWGLAIDMTKEALPAGQAIMALWSITGNLDIPGGMINVFPPFGVFMPWMANWGAEFLSKESIEKMLGKEKYPIWQTEAVTMASPDSVFDSLLTGKPYPLKAAWIQTNNPLACMSCQPAKMLEALKTLEFIVVVDIFMTPTAMAVADIVLPAATYPERDGIRAVWYSISTINQVTRVGDCKSDMEIALELGKRLNPEAWPWENVREMFSDMISQSGMNFEQLREKGWAYPPFEYKKHEKGLLRPDKSPGFNTPTGRIELYSTIFEAIGIDPLPYFEEPTESPLSTPELYQEYPLVLTTGARSWGLFHSEHRQVPILRALHPDPIVEIHPDTAAQYGIKNGDWVWIENRLGRCLQKAKLTPSIHPKIVNANHGWWFPERTDDEASLFGTFEANINNLIPKLPGRSGLGGNYKSLLCKIYKA